MTKRREVVSVHDITDGVEESIAFDRRTFLTGVGIAVLTMQCLPLTAYVSGRSSGHDDEAHDDLTVHLGPGFMSHRHDLLIPYALLQAPPVKGVELTTTQALFHRHTMALTREQLITVNQGGTVTGRASSHRYVIALANGRDHRDDVKQSYLFHP